MRALGALIFIWIQFLGWLTRLTPQFLLDFYATLGGYFWFDIVGFRRKIIILNLAHAFPRAKEESSIAFRTRIYRLARLNLKNYFLGFFEVLEKTTWSQKKLQSRVRLHGLEHVRKANDGGKQGIFLLASHIGNWEVSLALSQMVGIPLSCIVRFVRNSFWDEVLERSRKKFDINLLPEASSGMATVRAFKRGEMVAFVMDQHTGEPHGVKAKFFGLEAWTAKGLAVLSSKLKAPIVPFYSYRENGKVHVVFEPPMDFSDLGECKEEAQILAHVQRCNDKVEEWIRKFPEQYFWIHRRFKTIINYKEDSLPFP